MDRRKRFLSSDNYKTVKNSSQSIALESEDEQNYPTFQPYVRWCGQHEANMSRFNFISQSNEAFLHFHTDYSVIASGFSATWSTVDTSGCPVRTITSREGSISSPNYPHFMLNDLDCTFIIQAPTGQKVWIEFIAFEIIQDGFIEVDLGEGSFRPFQIKSHINDGVFLSKGERLVIRIQTGSKPRGKGFYAEFRTCEYLT